MKLLCFFFHIEVFLIIFLHLFSNSTYLTDLLFYGTPMTPYKYTHNCKTM